MSIPTFTLLHGAEIPAIGLGTSPMNDEDTRAAALSAIENGYRHIDTAENYGNEVGVGRAIAESGVPREELFITTKFNKKWHSVDGVRQAWRASCDRLGVDHLDLFLIHWPNPDQDQYVDAFRGLLELLADGSVRAIGTSNFKPAHLQRVLDETGERPDVNQVQLSPYTTRDATREFDSAHGILTESWSPIRAEGLLDDPVVASIAEQLGRSPAQVVLRWHHQLGLLPIPKSATPARIAENAAIFDFELTDDQVGRLSGLDRGEQAARDSDSFGH